MLLCKMGLKVLQLERGSLWGQENLPGLESWRSSHEIMIEGKGQAVRELTGKGQELE